MRIRPTTPRIAPRITQGRWSIMKLDAGQWIRPAPWPIQSNPTNTAAEPTISGINLIISSRHEQVSEPANSAPVWANLRAVQILLGHSKTENTVLYPGGGT